VSRHNGHSLEPHIHRMSVALRWAGAISPFGGRRTMGSTDSRAHQPLTTSHCSSMVCAGPLNRSAAFGVSQPALASGCSISQSSYLSRGQFSLEATICRAELFPARRDYPAALCFPEQCPSAYLPASLMPPLSGGDYSPCFLPAREGVGKGRKVTRSAPNSAQRARVTFGGRTMPERLVSSSPRG
jgi:hypothetical protein